MIAYLLLFFIIFGKLLRWGCPWCVVHMAWSQNAFVMHLRNFPSKLTDLNIPLLTIISFPALLIANSMMIGFVPLLPSQFLALLISPLVRRFSTLFWFCYWASLRWNSTSWDEFSRKWNKPVHAFLLRHVYAPTIMGYGLSRTTAMFLTFLLSASVHELVMVIVTQKFRYDILSYVFFESLIMAIGCIFLCFRYYLLSTVAFVTEATYLHLDRPNPDDRHKSHASSEA